MQMLIAWRVDGAAHSFMNAMLTSDSNDLPLCTIVILSSLGLECWYDNGDPFEGER